MAQNKLNANIQATNKHVNQVKNIRHFVTVLNKILNWLFWLKKNPNHFLLIDIMPLSSFQMWQINQYPGVQLVFPQLYSLVDKRVVTVRIHPLGSRVENLEPVRVDLVLGVWQHLVPVCKNNARHSKKILIFYRNSCTVVSWITQFLYKCLTWQCWQGISRCTVFWRPAYFSCHHPLLPVSK